MDACNYIKSANSEALAIQMMNEKPKKNEFKSLFSTEDPLHDALKRRA